MSEDYSYIEVSRETNSLGMIERMSYKWVGKSPICYLGFRMLLQDNTKYDAKNKTAQVGPYKLKLLEDDGYVLDNKWIRLDYPFWWALVFWHRISRVFEIAYHRTIITLAVWNLAEHTPGMIPTYKDIYLVQKITRHKDKPNN